MEQKGSIKGKSLDVALTAAPSQVSQPAVWSKNRIAILEWLDKRDQTLAELYSTVIFLIFESDSIRARGRMAAHGVREIANNLPKFLGVASLGRAQYTQLADNVLNEWLSAGLPLDNGPLPVVVDGEGKITDKIPVPIPLLVSVGSLLDEHKMASGRAKQNAEAIFLTLNADVTSSREILEPAIKQWRKVCGWFVGKVHLNGEADHQVLDSEFYQQFDIFENLLLTMSLNFFEVVEGIDEILDQANA